MREAFVSFLYYKLVLVCLSNGAKENEQFNLFLVVISPNFIFFLNKLKDRKKTPTQRR